MEQPKRSYYRFWVLVALNGAAATIGLTSLLRPNPVALFLLAPAIAAAGLSNFHEGYLFQRRRSFRRRESSQQAQPADKSRDDVSVLRPEDYPGGAEIHRAQWEFLRPATDAQGHYFAASIILALLPSAALVFLSVQILFFPEGGSTGVGLVVAEIMCLTLMVYFAWTRIEPTSDWIESRLRAEILRREQYLLVAGVGPYHGMAPTDAAMMSLTRIAKIKSSSRHVLRLLVPLEEPGSGGWIEEACLKPQAAFSHEDLVARVRTYLNFRIGKQRVWFANEVRDLKENDRAYSAAVKAACLLAVVIACVHATQLTNVSHDHVWSFATSVFAFTLPPLGAALISIRSTYAFSSRRILYEQTKDRLELLEGDFGSLMSRIESNLNVDAMLVASREFRIFVIHAEQILSLEMQQWVLVMAKEEHEAIP